MCPPATTRRPLRDGPRLLILGGLLFGGGVGGRASTRLHDTSLLLVALFSGYQDVVGGSLGGTEGGGEADQEGSHTRILR